MQVSVIVPTYNGALKISNILNALKKQTYSEFEIIVINDGSTDNTANVVKANSEGFKNFMYIEQSNKGRSIVRNNGASAATGELLIFFDDDMLPLEDCVERHLLHHQNYPNTILTGGLCEKVNKLSTEMMKYKAYLSDKWSNQIRTEEGRLLPDNIAITAANLSISKNVFNKLGGFDEHLNDAEDFELAIRAHKKGILLYYDPKVFAWHNDHVTGASYIKRQRQYTKAHKTLILLKPWMAKEGFIKPVKGLSGWRHIFFKFFAKPFWVKIIDTGKLKLLPKSIRYKIYDLIITANGVYFPDKVLI